MDLEEFYSGKGQRDNTGFGMGICDGSTAYGCGYGSGEAPGAGNEYFKNGAQLALLYDKCEGSADGWGGEDCTSGNNGSTVQI